MFIKAIFTDYSTTSYNFDNKSFHWILIKLFESPAIEKWFKYSKDLNIKKSYFYNKVINQKFFLHEEFKKICNNQWELVKQTLQDIKNLNYNIPFTIPEAFNFEQDTLNLLHRFFTYNAKWGHSNFIIENPFDRNFKLPENFNKKDWFYLINKINLHVHFLERYTIPKKNRIFVSENYPLEYLHFSIKEEDYEKYLDFDSNEYQNNYKFLDLNYENIVTLDASILGKSILQSFIEHDDPTCWDCQGRHCSGGGFMIYTDNQLKKIYTSVEFQNWIKKYNLESSKIPYEFSIGYVQEQSTPLKNLLINQLIGLEYID